MTRARWLPLVGVLALAVATRWWLLFAAAGGQTSASYDQSVYYAAAVALVHGRFPYHGDFVFLHPPVVALAGTPFALFGRLTNDMAGFLAENLAFAVVGAVNAVLVVLAARAWGLGRGALAAGFVYAVWPVAFAAESTARLEPIGNLFLVLCLWALGRGREGATRPLVLAGVFLGILVNVKLWWFPPALALVVLTAVGTRRARVAWVPVLAGAVTATIVDLPFLLVAGPRMFRSIVTAQLGRPDRQWTPGGHFTRLSIGQRLEQLTGASPAVGGLVRHGAAPDGLVTLVAVGVLIAFLVTAALACRHPVGRVLVAVLLLQAAVLLTAPIFYSYYGDYPAVTAALVVAAAAGPQQGRRLAMAPRAWAVVAALGGALTLVGIGLPLAGSSAGPSAGSSVDSSVDWAALRSAASAQRCVVSDSPLVLIRLDALDRSLTPGCRNVVDFQGVSYGAGPRPRAKAAVLSSTPAYKRFVTRYLTSGDAVVLRDYYVRVRLGSAVVHRIQRGRVLARSGDVVMVARSGSGRR